MQARHREVLLQAGDREPSQLLLETDTSMNMLLQLGILEPHSRGENTELAVQACFWTGNTQLLRRKSLTSRILATSQSTLRLVLTNMTAWVMVRVSYKSTSVSNFHSSRSTDTKNCLMPFKATSWHSSA